MTISQYLQRKKQENPELANVADMDLYRRLIQEKDPGLPSFSSQNLTTGRRGQTAYERKADPNFVNSLFDWTDWGIDEGSARWAKSAYNNSITGLAYQLYNGEQRFNLDGYNPGMAEDIFSAVLSFMMPADLLSMRVGGILGRQLTGLAGYGFKQAAVDNFVKLSGKKLFQKGVQTETKEQFIIRKALAETQADDIIKAAGYSGLFQAYAPKAAGSIASAATLATFEGTRGGVAAAVNGEDVWEGIGGGVMHGGIMGGIIGAFGASLNVKNAALWNKVKSGKELTPKEAKKIAWWNANPFTGTGKAAQVVGEAGIFTAPEIKNVIMDEDYSMRDLTRSFFVNAGMMGVLKAQHGLQGKLWNQGKESLKEYYETEGKGEREKSERLEDSKNNIKEETGIDINVNETPSQRETRQNTRKEVDKFVDRQLDKEGITKEEYEKWEKEFDQATKDLDRMSPESPNYDPNFKMSDAGWQNVWSQVQKVYGSMKKNINRYKQDNPDITEAREAKLKEMESLADAWKTEIIDKYNNIETIKNKNTKLSETERKTKIKDAKGRLNVAWEKATDAEKKNLREGIEDKINEKGEIVDESAWAEISENVDRFYTIRGESEAPVTPVTVSDKKVEIKQRMKDEVVKSLDTNETIKKDIVEKFERGNISSEKRQHEEWLNESDTRIQNTKLGKEGSHQREAYNESKGVLAYIARKLIPGRKAGVTKNSRTEINHLDKLAKELAEDGRSLFEIKDKDILSYVQRTGIKQEAITKLLDAFKQIKTELDVKNKDLFKNLRDFDLIKLEGQNLYDAIGKMYDVGKKGGKGEGLQTPKGKESGFEIIKDDTITIRGKTRTYTKYITDTLKKGLDYLIGRTKTLDGPAGHNDYLIRDITGEALTTKEINILTREIFGKRKLSSGDFGEGRLFRNSIAQWAKEKLKPEDALLIDAFVLGHGSEKSMFETYAGKMKPSEAKRRVKELIKEYIKDITDPNGFKSSNKKEGYSTNEIRKGLNNLKKHKGNISFKDRNGNFRAVDKKTLQTMFEYMIETGPRLNEIAPSPDALKAREKYATEKFQLEGKERTAESIVSARELTDQVAWVKEKFPQLSVQIEKSLGTVKGQQVLGKIAGRLIKIAEGKAKVDTLPHEVSHHVVDVLRELGDPFSKKLVKDGIEMFKKKGMSKAQAEEAFVEALGKYTSKQLPKRMMGRVGSWVKRMWSHLKQRFGLTNRRDVQQMQKDIVRIIGGKVLSGKIPTDIMPLKSRIKVKYQKSGTPTGNKAVDKARKRVEELEKRLIEDYGYTKGQLQEIGENIIGKKEYKKLTVSDIERYEARLNILGDKYLEGKPKKLSVNESKVEEIETQYDISVEQRDKFFKDVYNTTLEKANDIMIKNYNSYVRKGNEVVPKGGGAGESLIDIGETPLPSLSIFARPFMTAADVVYKYGGKPGKIIAEKLLTHDFTRSVYKGEGEVVIERIKNVITDKKVKTNYMHLLDKELAAGALKGVKQKEKEYNKLIEEGQAKGKNPYTKERKEMEQTIKDFAKGGKYYEARELWENLSKFYWNSLTKEISLNTRGNREFQQIKKELNEKFINQYFARKVTKQALEHIKKESPEIEAIVNREFNKLTKEDLKRASKDLGVDMKDPMFEKNVKDMLAEELLTMIDFGPTRVNPNFLKERGALLPEYMTITLNNGMKKTIKTYETSLDATIGSYVNGMAKYLATVKHFPEFTQLKGKFSFKPDAKLRNLELMSKDKGLGAYAAETVRAQLGLDYSNRDILMNPVNEGLGKLTNWSAFAGLSSPMSGLKNILIQVPRSVAIYGVRNTVRSMGYSLKAMKDPKLFEKAMREGQIGYGTKELIRKEAPLIRWWFDNVNGMTTTENFNRIVLAEAGKMHFTELLNVARGTKSMFHPQGKKSEVMRMFKETWKLKDSDIKFLVEGKNIFGTKRYHKIMERVGFESHKSGAGATGVSDLPLWMTNKYIKPFTLFARMATSVTIDSYKNYVKPIKNGNLAPLLRATIGHGLSGVALYWIYDKFMGQQPPDEENPAIDRAVSYLWKGEFLGMFGEIISPYDKGMSIPIMEPIILRNAKNAWSEVSQVLGYGKSAKQAISDFTLNSFVLANQAKRTFDNFNHPYSTNYKRVKALRRKFNEAMGYEVPQGSFMSSRQPYYYKLKKSIMYGKSDSEIALSYYNAFNYICSQLEEDGVSSKSIREKKAKQAIDAVIRHMHPVNLPDDKKGRRDSKRNEFLGYLSKENKELALGLEKEWKYKERQFYKIIKNHKWKRKYSLYAYYD